LTQNKVYDKLNSSGLENGKRKMRFKKSEHGKLKFTLASLIEMWYTDSIRWGTTSKVWKGDWM